MRSIPLEPDEYIVEEQVKKSGGVTQFLLRYGLSVFAAVVILRVVYWFAKIYAPMSKDPALVNESSFQNLPYYYLPVFLVFCAVVIWYTYRIGAERVVLTNKAILQVHATFVERLNFKDIIHVKAQPEVRGYTFTRRTGSILIGNLLGTNWQVSIKARPNTDMTVSTITQYFAHELVAKLDLLKAANP